MTASSTAAFKLPTDAKTKAFVLARTRVLRQIYENLNDAKEARRREQDIYASANDIGDYLDRGNEHLRLLQLHAEDEEEIDDDDDDEREEKKSIVSEADLRNMFKVSFDDLVDGNKRLARCPRCKSIDVYVATAQLRSADEGMSIIAVCERCGFSWKQR